MGHFVHLHPVQNVLPQTFPSQNVWGILPQTFRLDAIMHFKIGLIWPRRKAFRQSLDGNPGLNAGRGRWQGSWGCLRWLAHTQCRRMSRRCGKSRRAQRRRQKRAELGAALPVCRCLPWRPSHQRDATRAWCAPLIIKFNSANAAAAHTASTSATTTTTTQAPTSAG